MKTSKTKLFALLFLISMAFGCEEDDGPDFETVPFEANFFTVLSGLEENAGGCSAPMNFLNTQEGNGSATLLGDFTTSITFCVDLNTLAYGNGQGSFVGNNGDEIFFEGGGQIKPSDKPGYNLEFQDAFTITGGTGQFVGATGQLTTDSYVNMTTQQTDHVWSGTITVRK